MKRNNENNPPRGGLLLDVKPYQFMAKLKDTRSISYSAAKIKRVTPLYMSVKIPQKSENPTQGGAARLTSRSLHAYTNILLHHCQYSLVNGVDKISVAEAFKKFAKEQNLSFWSE